HRKIEPHCIVVIPERSVRISVNHQPGSKIIVTVIALQHALFAATIDIESSAIHPFRLIGETLAKLDRHAPGSAGPDSHRTATCRRTERTIVPGRASLDQPSVHLVKHNSAAGMTALKGRVTAVIVRRAISHLHLRMRVMRGVPS